MVLRSTRDEAGAALRALAGPGIYWHAYGDSSRSLNGYQPGAGVHDDEYSIRKVKYQGEAANDGTQPRYQYHVSVGSRLTLVATAFVPGDDPNPLYSRAEAIAACERHCFTGKWRMSVPDAASAMSHATRQEPETSGGG